MLTPAFDLRQDERFLFICIKVPFAKISETEVFIEEHEFKFYSKPYFLRLNLPGQVVEDGQETAKYDADKGEFNIRVAKVKRGEHFEGLDMLTTLLAPRGKTSAEAAGIEVIGESTCELQEEEEEFDWQVEQHPFVEEGIMVGMATYGFANQRTGVLSRLQEELLDVVDVTDADNTPLSERRRLRLVAEHAKFDDEHYLADFYEDDTIMGLIMHKPPWADEYMNVKHGTASVIEFTEDEKDRMRNLPRKEYLLDSTHQQVALLGLVDILFAYAYNHRSTEGDNSVESAWTICKMSSTLSWLESFTNVNEVALSCYRRSLCYPLYRHWKLTQKVWMDMCRIITVGKQRILKCLLETHKLLANTEGHYILNDLYITDYCVWLQTVSTHKFESLAAKLQSVKIAKSDVDLHLELLEQAGSLAMAEHQAANQITQQVSALTLTPTETANLTPCKKCSPSSSSFEKRNLDESFPKADLDLASSTDSCSESETESESESDTEHNASKLSTICEESNGEEAKTKCNNAASKTKADTDSSTLNF